MTVQVAQANGMRIMDCWTLTSGREAAAGPYCGEAYCRSGAYVYLHALNMLVNHICDA